MRKFLACILCAVVSISTMIVSVSAAETGAAVSDDSYRNKFISALMKEESVWKDSPEVSAVMKSEIQFIDLNFDGKKEFVVQYYGNGTVHGSNIYYLNNGSVRKIENNDPTIFVQTESLKGYYNSTSKEYMMLGSYSKSVGIVGDVDCYNFELAYDTGNQSILTDIYSRYELVRRNNGTDNAKTFYSANNDALTEKEYNTVNAEKIAGYEDVNLKFEKEDIRNYTPKSDKDKKALLEWLYDSSVYGTVESKSEPDPNPQPTPNPDNNNNNDSTIKSPKTGVQNNYAAVVLAVILAGGAAAVLANKKRKENF